MINFYQQVVDILSNGETIAIATVIKTKGSAPRSVGTKVIIRCNGSIYGTIGGDELEKAVIRDGIQAIQKRESRVCEYDLLLKGEGGIGMPCGGKVSVFIDVANPKPMLIIIGGGYIAAALVKLGKICDFQVIVIDSQAKPEEFEEANRVIGEPIEEAISKVRINPETYIAIIGRYDQDVPALKSVINSRARYIGMIGSKKRIALALNKLKQENIGLERGKLHSPIGIEIGAETPEEVAISIMAEIIKIRRIGD